MGQYTNHWELHKRQSLRGTLQALAAVAIGVPALAAAGYGLSPLNDRRTVLLLILVAAWLVALTRIVVRASKVTCPRCGTGYSRGKFLVNCPSCGLRMFQEDP